MAKHRRKKLLARAARADGFSVSTASSPGLFGPQPIPRKAESDDDDESDAGAPAAAISSAAIHASTRVPPHADWMSAIGRSPVCSLAMSRTVM